MISFNGVDLQEIVPIKIEDIRVSPIDTTPAIRQRIDMGQDFIRMTGSNRTAAITFALLTEDINERYSQIQQIVEWANPYNEGVLKLPMFENRYLSCRCTGYPEPSYRQWWESKLRLVFTTFENPYWNSDDEIRAKCNVPFSVGGTAQPLMRIERNVTSQVANQTYTANGQSMFFEKIPAGRLVIDLNRQTAAVSETSIMQFFGKTGKFITPTIGNITIKGNGTIYYRERWV